MSELVNSVSRSRRSRWLLIAAFTILATACAGSDANGSVAELTEAAVAGELSPEQAAEVNQPLLQPSDSIIDFEVLDVADGSISTLSDAVDGDRPVLLWFFSPH